jgi:hypothetical protein
MELVGADVRIRPNDLTSALDGYKEGRMQYRVFSGSGNEPLDTVEMHVLARAYRAAWRSRFARDPVGRHVIAALDVVFVFSNGES